ncbi:phage terminase small subunit P27 family [Rubrivirga marina]|uniref:Terminase n=1 Tax=Rubrivirga marina TaxID=1196024 RepID=A0A271J4M2_9BACT|nr:phage terminase small subunit P27 family [Rubrivirga marina]PAP78004.1 hypothetical protein BSZ37_16930 [Rubrivirga marina]
MGGIGSGGHNRKRATLHKLQGTFRGDRHGRSEKVAGGPPAQVTPPRWLDAEAKRFWRRNAPLCVELGTLDAINQPLFERMCATWSTIRAWEGQIAEDGPTVQMGTGSVKPHPLIAAKQKEEQAFVRLADGFGITTAGRKRLGLDGAEADSGQSEPNAFARLGPGARTRDASGT